MHTVRAAIYARVSTKPQAGEDKVSIPDQLRECRKFIEQQEDWHCAGEFVDPGISANTIERPGLKKLLSSLGQFDVVLAWDFDRFYRERRSVAGYILDTLDEHKKTDHEPQTADPHLPPFALRSAGERHALHASGDGRFHLR